MTAQLKDAKSIMFNLEKLTNDDIIAHTQLVRSNILNTILATSTEMPTTGDNLKEMRDLLNDLSETAIKNKKVTVEEVNSNTDARNSKVAEDIARSIRLSIMNNAQPTQGINNEPVIDLDQLGDMTLVPGQDKLGMDPCAKEDFIES